MSHRNKSRRAAEAELKRIYAEVPEIDCQGHCHRTCGPVPFSPLEVVRIDEYIAEQGMPDPPITYPVTMCPLLTADKKCSVHPVRPLICRGFGVVDAKLMTCVWGCKPKRKLTNVQFRRLFDKLDALEARLTKNGGLK